MSVFDDKYFSFVASSYGITFLIFAGLIVWIRIQYRLHNAKMSELEKLGISRRSEKSRKVGGS